jgi:toxin ParE1/3/4
MTVRFTPAAREQFLRVISYILADSPSAALSFRNRADNTLQRLIKFPESGRPIPEFPDLSYREVIVGNYRFFYRLRARTVWIVAVWHGAQLPRSPEQKGGG